MKRSERQEKDTTKASGSERAPVERDTAAGNDKRVLACPCFKYNPIRYRDCLARRRLTRISDVRLHLKRVHGKNPQCVRCGQVFRSAMALKDHQRDATVCELKSFRSEGFDLELLDELDMVSRRLGPELQWKAIWNVIYPESEMPDSPYVGNIREEMARIRRRAIQAHRATSDSQRQVEDKNDPKAIKDASESKKIESLLDWNYIKSLIPDQDDLSYLTSDNRSPKVMSDHSETNSPKFMVDFNADNERLSFTGQSQSARASGDLYRPPYSLRPRRWLGEKYSLSEGDNPWTRENDFTKEKLQVFLRAFSTRLCDSLIQKPEENELGRICRVLPQLLKIFTVRLWNENTDKTLHPAMYSIYGFAQSVVDEFKRKVREHMDIRSKLSESGFNESEPGLEEWTSAITNYLLEWDDSSNQDRLYLASEHSMRANRLDYDKSLPIIMDSLSYRWLAASIISQSNLYVPGQGHVSGGIGKMIISAMTPSKQFEDDNSQKILLSIFTDWDPFKFMKEQGYEQSLPYILAHAITLTGQGNNVQAMSCESYLEQTWPVTGPMLLRFLQKALDSGSNYRETLPDRTLLIMRRTPLELKITVVGNVFSVSEIVEQLSWIAAALRSSPYSTDMAYCCPRIVDLKLDDTLEEGTERSGTCRLEFQTEEAKYLELQRTGNCWRGMFRNPVIVKGYPIQRRPKANTGLDISLDIVAALTNCRQRTRLLGGQIFLKGFAAMLSVSRIIGEAVFWHLCYNENGDYISYEDARAPRLSLPQATFLSAHRVLSKRQHIVGWTDNVRNYAGHPDAQYEIEWTGLPNPNSKCVFEKVSLAAPIPHVAPRANLAIGIKEKPLHLGFGSGDDYMGTLFTLEKRSFVFYDAEERRAWLINGLCAVLHLLRAYLKFATEDRMMRKHLVYSEGDLQGPEPDLAYTGAEAAMSVLGNLDNQNIALYPKAGIQTEETVTKLGSQYANTDTSLKVITSNFTLKDRVEQICRALLQVTAYYDDVATEAGYGCRLKKSPFHQLEGFEFMDIATRYDTIWPKVATVHAMSLGWVHLIRALHAVPLFGVGFGDLIKPHSSGAPCCASTSPVPPGKDLLAVYGADLEEILRRGSRRRIPWKLAGNMHWHSPGAVAFEPCKCRKPSQDVDQRENSDLTTGGGKSTLAPGRREKRARHDTGTLVSLSRKSKGKGKEVRRESPADRVQVLLPGTFRYLYTRGLRSPDKIEPKGAVIFGHNVSFPLRWNPHKDDPPEEGEPDPIPVDDVASMMEDSGIGASNASSSEKEGSPSNMYSLGYNPRLAKDESDVSVETWPSNADEYSREDDEQESKRRRVNRVD